MGSGIKSLKYGCAIIGLFGVPAYAQETPAPDHRNSITVPEIIVTAEKREQNLMTTSIVGAVLDNDVLRDRLVQDVTDLQRLTPGLTITGGTKLVNIRGVGISVLGPTGSSGVTSYIDGGVIFHETTLVYPNFDVARFEVLRGPQGTLSGSNSTGGSILVVSNQPEFDGFHGIVEQRFENYDHFRTDVAVNLPVSDTLAFRVAAVHDSTDGFITNVNPNAPTKPDAETQFGLRIGGRFEPNDKFSALAHFEYGATKGEGGDAVPTQFHALYNHPLNPREPFKVYYDEANTFSNAFVARANGKLTYNITDDIAVSSFTAWSHYTQRVNADGDFGPEPIQVFNVRPGYYIDTFQQEFNILSDGDGPFSFLLGGYYLKDIVNNDLLILINAGAVVVEDFTHQVAKDKAVFGQVEYDLTPELQVQIGGRYTHNKRSQDDGLGNVLADYNFNVVTAKIGLNYQPSPDHFFYAFAARGGKAGGFNFSTSQYGPESNWDFEIGWKGSLLDRQLRMQVNAFYMDYKGYQISGVRENFPIAEIFNTGGAKIKGLELSLDSNFGGLQLYGTFSYIDSSIKNQLLGDSRFPANPLVQIGGNRLPFSPKIQFNAGIAYDFAVNNGGTLTPRAQVAYLDDQWVSVFQVPVRDFMPSYAVVDASLTYASDDGWSLSLYGQNLLDETYLTFINTSGSTPRQNYGDPRTFGIRGTFRF